MTDFKVFINFKTYPQGTGERAVELVRELERVLRQAQDYKEIASQARNDTIEVIPIVQAVDVWRIKQETKLPVWVQNVHSQSQGKFTGWTNLEAVIEAGGVGSLVNHSEHPVPPGTVKQVVGRVNQLNKLIKSNEERFETMVCGKTLGQIERLVKFKPDYIGYEIAELIGTKTSIMATNPKAIEHAVKICGEIPLIVGAGVNSSEDLVIARKLGAKGVLISSAILLVSNPGTVLKELTKDFVQL